MASRDHDDPFNYFQRLQSYSSKTSFSRPSSSARKSPSHLSSLFGLERYNDSPTKSEKSAQSSRRPHARTESITSLWNRSDDRSVSALEKPTRSLRSDALRELDGSDTSTRRRWSRKRKIIIGGIFFTFALLALLIGVIAHFKLTAFSYTASDVQVTNEKAFNSGGATHTSIYDVEDGIGKGQDKYTYYQGGPEKFPLSSIWVSFEDMWKDNLGGIESSCNNLGEGTNNTPQQTQDVYNAIQSRANASLVDHRFILAVILQESHGCVHVGHTTSSGGVSNPGLMQSHDGHSFSSYHPSLSILAMVQDGTQGTSKGAGLVQNLNRYGDPYTAARGYNSGHIAANGDLSAAAGATACYVSDVANRLTGWVKAKTSCPGDTE